MRLPPHVGLCLATFLAIPCTQAGNLQDLLARNAALPRAPQLAESAFEQEERLRQVRLSPDGRQLTYIETDRGSAELRVLDLASGATSRLLALDGQARVQWSPDSGILFVAQSGGVAAVDPRSGASSRIAVFDKPEEISFAGPDPVRPRHALLIERGKSQRLVRIGLDGTRQVLYSGAEPVGDFLLGADGQPAVLRTTGAGFHQRILQRHAGGWREAARCLPFRPCRLAALTPDGQRLLLLTPHAGDREALVELTLATGARRTLHQDPDGIADLAGVIPGPDGQPLLAEYELPYRRIAGLDAAGRRIAAGIARRFPAGGVTVESCAPSACLVAERGARLSQARYWLYDIEGGKLRAVLEDVRQRARPLPERQLVDKIASQYRASDGALVHGYLSLPAGLPARSLPMLTVVHGGPWNHVGADYSALAQLLANRGYAVFQPNFRASTGYGEKYMLAPGASFGNGRAQADIIEGVQWLLAQGVGDPGRQGIMGASFGGYATLLALTHTPGMFRFGLAGQATPDFARTLQLTAAAPAKPGETPFAPKLRELGIDPANAGQMAPIRRDAPLAHANRLGAPLALIAGGKDELIEIEAVVDYVARLQGLGKPVSLLVDPDEGHHARNPVARKAQLHLLLAMLHRYLGGPAPAAPEQAVARYLANTMRADGALK